MSSHFQNWHKMQAKICSLKVSEKFKCIVADPPWFESGGGRICRGAQRHYPIVRDADIVSTITSSPYWLPDKDGCHLWLWVTNNRLPLGLSVMRELGFTYKTNLCWSKDRIGIGQYLRGMHELCLFGVMGGVMLPEIRNVPSLFRARRTEHSKKPDEAFELIERVSPSPRLEMFARRKRKGWQVWGNEVIENVENIF